MKKLFIALLSLLIVIPSFAQRHEQRGRVGGAPQYSMYYVDDDMSIVMRELSFHYYVAPKKSFPLQWSDYSLDFNHFPAYKAWGFGFGYNPILILAPTRLQPVVGLDMDGYIIFKTASSPEVYPQLMGKIGPTAGFRFYFTKYFGLCCTASVFKNNISWSNDDEDDFIGVGLSISFCY